MCLLFVGTIQDAWLGPDREEVVVGRGYTICWRPDPEFDAIKRERKIRWGLGVGSEVFSGLGALWYVSISSCSIDYGCPHIPI